MLRFVKVTALVMGALAITSAAHAAKSSSHGTKTPSPTPTPGPISQSIVPSPANFPKFAATSFWYTPLPASAPLDPNTANLNAEFLRQYQTYYGNVGVNTSAYSAPIYIAAAGAPTQQVTVF